ncbi:hypothetical protein [Thermoactinomyces sp. DSM 45892]|uniref:hypothetical protein n=1 Tax=Thermoactinomyces sp. DSM 45892 TaxID=1882753 RepID=UPI0008965856|nr:hypothetical protein [Thermoactinomyces sp. DSM 45892]SDY68788.1 hypothetical protein SAMN05444416_10777 [Thermoactinomyces sp. DSM 45892]
MIIPPNITPEENERRWIECQRVAWRIWDSLTIEEQVAFNERQRLKKQKKIG